MYEVGKHDIQHLSAL